MGTVVVAGVGVFLMLLVLQITIWRVIDVRREMLGLAMLFLVAPAVLAVSLAIMAQTNILDLVMSGFLYLALACGYIQTYPALREDVPSFRILFAIDESGSAQLSEEELMILMQSGHLVSKKLQDLSHDRLVGVKSDGFLYLLPAGRVLALVFRAYRKALGLSRGLG